MVKNIFKDNKGNAIYYVMIMLIIVTLILSGALYASYRNAVITTNYSSGEADYYKCDGALEALRSQLAVSLTGKTVDDISVMTGADKDHVFIQRGSVSSLPLDASDQVGYSGFYIYLIEDCRDIIKLNHPDEMGFKADEIISDGSLCGISIEEVVAEYGGTKVISDIILVIEDNKITDVVFDNYRVENILPQTEEADNGGGQSNED